MTPLSNSGRSRKTGVVKVMYVHVQLNEALAADTVSTLVNGLRSAILRTNNALFSSSSSRGYSRDQSRGQQSRVASSGDVSRSRAQCKAMQTTLPHGRTVASSLKQVIAFFSAAA